MTDGATPLALNPAIVLTDQSYIILDGLHVDNVRRWLWAAGTTHSIIRNCFFNHAYDLSGSAHMGLYFELASYNQLLNNTIQDTTQDNVVLVYSDHNLVEGNTIIDGNHTLWASRCSSYNVIRNNFLKNTKEKGGEMFDCGGLHLVGSSLRSNASKLWKLDSAKYNVIEGNRFAQTMWGRKPTGLNNLYTPGIQFAAQHTIIRKNMFYNAFGDGIMMTSYADEAQYDYSNRVYNNTFSKNKYAGIDLSGAGKVTFSDNIIVNNSFSRSQYVMINPGRTYREEDVDQNQYRSCLWHSAAF